jgi:hypothetical protein
LWRRQRIERGGNGRIDGIWRPLRQQRGGRRRWRWVEEAPSGRDFFGRDGGPRATSGRGYGRPAIGIVGLTHDSRLGCLRNHEKEFGFGRNGGIF